MAGTKKANRQGQSPAAENMGLLFGCCELGGAGVPTAETVAVAETGVRNIMKHFGLMKGELETPGWRGEKRSMLGEALSSRHYSKATESGIFEPLVEIGEPVEAGQAIGQIHSLDAAGLEASVQRFPLSGLVYCRRALGRIKVGETVAVLARERQDS
ncbi:succinylglutamate desuccinylase/aspartoacylase domain-containing protein (plasmid) [Rhizobium etli bv. mimosae str. Mim1]|nr:succinylglutamate desuccinylase/aspartoacylase family protein [Rhizobium etli]AGS24477.1 succinylglutamate desuccinylase/aspartoacylase domain-containing protein [Rhizobium etli bv. mimosae str. Mim1]